MPSNRLTHVLRRYVILFFAVFTLLPLVAVAAPEAPPSPHMVPNPGADLWRAVRQREPAQAGHTQVKGVEAGVFINAGGEGWRHFRMNQLVPYSGWLFGGIAAVIVLFFLVLILGLSANWIVQYRERKYLG